MSYKVKRNGWLWRLHKEFNSEVYCKLRREQPVGLCLFFWNSIYQILKLVSVLFCLLLVVTGFLAVSSLFVLVVANIVVGLLSAAVGWYLPWVDYTLSMCLVYLSLFCASVYVLKELFLRMIGSSNTDLEVAPQWVTKHFIKVGETEEYEDEDKPVGLVKSYWRAFKDKVCPLVEVE